MTSGEARNLNWAAVMGSAAICIIGLMHVNAIYRFIGGRVVYWIYELTLIAFGLAASALALLLWRSFSRGEVLKRVWGTMALGLLLWTIGEVLWAFYDLILHQDPFPSLADAAYLVGYGPVGAALFLRYRSLRIVPNLGRALIVLSVFGLFSVLAIVLVIWPILSDAQVAFIERILSALYALGDLAVLLGAMLIALAVVGGRLLRPWAVIAAGFLVVGFADLVISYADWNGTYLPGLPDRTNFITGLANVPYFAAYVILTFGLYVQARLQMLL